MTGYMRALLPADGKLFKTPALMGWVPTARFVTAPLRCRGFPSYSAIYLGSLYLYLSSIGVMPRHYSHSL